MNQLPVGKPQDFLDGIVRDGFARIRNCLVENALGVAHAAFPGFGNPGQGPVADLYAFGIRYLSQVGSQGPDRNAPEIVPLAARQDGRRDLVQFGRGEDEQDVGGRLLDDLEQGIEGLLGQHVDFVDYIDLETR